ncbi:MAG: hypothetical protein A3G35_00385 [candidate division NC10 bacterium RIFCSPLOWO2_12_FULL_66_18]|nr:MAG: hypothetical protein A3G35_00385 [candidate division NC10 bacterium RIFCSPLOWO2_12_FULL_66_18]
MVVAVLRVAAWLDFVDCVPDLVVLLAVVLPERVEVDDVVLVEVALVVPDVLLPVPAVEEPLVFPWASWTAELTASPRLLNPASCAAPLPAWAVEVAASETALPTPRPA